MWIKECTFLSQHVRLFLLHHLLSAWAYNFNTFRHKQFFCVWNRDRRREKDRTDNMWGIEWEHQIVFFFRMKWVFPYSSYVFSHLIPSFFLVLLLLLFTHSLIHFHCSSFFPSKTPTCRLWTNKALRIYVYFSFFLFFSRICELCFHQKDNKWIWENIYSL